MAASSSFIITLLLAFSMSCTAKLSQNYYSKSCPNILDTVKSVVESAVSKESRMGASILRLHFHDCFINGCDGSILLDETSSMKSEKSAPPNINSARGFDVIDDIKFKVEQVCPNIVSCADILTIATRDSVVLLGGPSWDVKLGRRDSKTANFSAAANGAFIPSPASNLSTLISNFQAQGLSVKDMIALSGAHTIGQARCAAFRVRVYDAININNSFAKLRRQKCPKSKGSGDNNLVDLDIQTPNKFDSSYFKLLVNQKGLLNSDQELLNGGSTDSLVKKYSNNEKAFYDDFVKAMIKMGNIKPLAGSDGEIRKDCRKAN